jgi:large subunit ribosomal protein L26e
MSAALNKDLRKKHEIKSLPVRKDDEVQIMNGTWKGQKGKVTQVYRLRNCLYIEKISKNKLNGQSIRIPIHPSNVRITNIKMTKDRQNLIDRKRAGRGDGKNKGKYTAQDVN